MKKLLGSFVFVMVILIFAVNVTYASGSEIKVQGDPFDGTFTGTVTGDRDSEAEVTVVLDHNGNLVEGEMNLGEGLYVDGGLCWHGYLPEGVFSAIGNTLPSEPSRVQGKYSYEVNKVMINGYLDAELSPDGKNLEAEVKIDLPWFCGKDPVLQLKAEKMME